MWTRFMRQTAVITNRSQTQDSTGGPSGYTGSGASSVRCALRTFGASRSGQFSRQSGEVIARAAFIDDITAGIDDTIEIDGVTYLVASIAYDEAGAGKITLVDLKEHRS